MKNFLPAILIAAGCAAGPAPFFNGKDLTGWVRVNCAPGTFTVRDGMIVSTGVPTGVLRTERMYENFIVELEWKHLKEGGNAGLFVHSASLPAPGVPFTKSIEVQIIDGNDPGGNWTGHGDIFSIHGATFTPDRPHPKGWSRCLPSERRAKPAGEWNHYRVECRDGRISLAVNGKEVSGGTKCMPRKGYICLESEGTECHFRNLRITELPSSNPPEAETAAANVGYRPLYTGVDLSGWKGGANWQSKDWTIVNDGKGDAPLISEASVENFEMFFDFKLGAKVDKPVPLIEVCPGGMIEVNASGWNRLSLSVKAGHLTALLNGKPVEVRAVPTAPAPIRFPAPSVPLTLANLFVRP